MILWFSTSPGQVLPSFSSRDPHAEGTDRGATWTYFSWPAPSGGTMGSAPGGSHGKMVIFPSKTGNVPASFTTKNPSRYPKITGVITTRSGVNH